MSIEDIRIIMMELKAIKKDTEEIHKEAKLTNGRVKALELAQAKSDGAKESKNFWIPIVTAAGTAVAVAAVNWLTR